MGVWKCCLPWCSAAEGTAGPPSTPTTVPQQHLVLPAAEDSSPQPEEARTRQPSPLQDIAEEDVELDFGEEEESCADEEPSQLQPLGGRLSYKKQQQQRRNVQSPSPTLSLKTSAAGGGRKGQQQRTRSVTSTTSSECSSGPSVGAKMQAEQGSIGDLQKYHNRYLRNRRHTLANVR